MVGLGVVVERRDIEVEVMVFVKKVIYVGGMEGSDGIIEELGRGELMGEIIEREVRGGGMFGSCMEDYFVDVKRVWVEELGFVEWRCEGGSGNREKKERSRRSEYVERMNNVDKMGEVIEGDKGV